MNFLFVCLIQFAWYIFFVELNWFFCYFIFFFYLSLRMLFFQWNATCMHEINCENEKNEICLLACLMSRLNSKEKQKRIVAVQCHHPCPSKCFVSWAKQINKDIFLLLLIHFYAFYDNFVQKMTIEKKKKCKGKTLLISWFDFAWKLCDKTCVKNKCWTKTFINHIQKKSSHLNKMKRKENIAINIDRSTKPNPNDPDF